jgi:hypothetical protein
MPNPLSVLGITDEDVDIALSGDPEVARGLLELMGRMVADWKALSPVFDAGRDRRKDPGIGDPEDYKNSIHFELTKGRKGVPGGRVGTNDPKAIWIEVGSRHMPEYAPAAKVAALYGDTTGPIFSEGVMAAQAGLREALEHLAKARAGHAGTLREAIKRADGIKRAKNGVAQARAARSAAFKANRSRRRRGRSR